MTKKNQTKHSLLFSALSLLVCVAMLTGATFAWFTDNASNTGNKIVAGNLDVQLLMDTGSGYEDISANTNPIFGAGSIAQNKNSETLWEPGKTQVAYLAIRNNGNLELKYQVSLEVKNVSKDLYKAMKYAIIPDAQYGSVTSWTDGNTVVPGVQTVSAENVSLSVGDEHRFALAIHMNEDADNRYQGGEVDFDIRVLATQLAAEFDSFNNTYDENATYEVLTADALADSLSKGGTTDLLGNVSDAPSTTVNNSTVLNLKGKDMSGAESTNIINVAEGGELVIKDTYTDDQGNDVEGEGSITSSSRILTNAGKATFEGTNMTATSEAYGIITEGNEAVTVLNDVNYYAERGAFGVGSGKVIFNSGKVVVDGIGGKVGHVFYAYGDSVVEINGGEFIHNRNCTKGAMIYAADNAVITINGGSFTNGPNGYKGKWIQANNNSKVIIKGGRFQFDPSAFVADGYQAVQGTDKWWTVSKI